MKSWWRLGLRGEKGLLNPEHPMEGLGEMLRAPLMTPQLTLCLLRVGCLMLQIEPVHLL